MSTSLVLYVAFDALMRSMVTKTEFCGYEFPEGYWKWKNMTRCEEWECIGSTIRFLLEERLKKISISLFGKRFNVEAGKTLCEKSIVKLLFGQASHEGQSVHFFQVFFSHDDRRAL